MSYSPSSSTAQKLVQAFSDIASTEDFIIYVAGTDKMLTYCQNLIEQYDRDQSGLLTLEINSLCSAHGILPGLLFSEVRKVLIALNRFHDSEKDHYATLGVPENASLDEIKKAYRQLSKRYHPDITKNEHGDTQQRFMEVAGAYHAIMASRNDTATPAASKHWRRKNRKHRSSSLSKRNFLLTLIPLIVVLVGFSLYISGIYDEQVVLSQIEASSLSTPDANIIDSVSKDTSASPLETEPAAQLTAEKNAAEDEPEHSIVRSAPEQALQRLPQGETVSPTHPIESNVIQPQSEPVVAAEPAKVESNPDEPDPALTHVEPVKHESHIQQTLQQEEVEPEQVEIETQTPEPERMPNSAEPEVAEEPAPQLPAGAAASIPVVTKTTSSSQDRITTAAAITTTQKKRNITKAQPVHQVVPEKKEIKVVQKKSKGKDLKSSVEEILSQYANSYSTKNLEQMLAYFHPDATENGHLQSELIDRYRSLFTHTKKIELDLGPILWNEVDRGVEARCEFKADYTYKDGHTNDHTGEIKFYLTSEEGSLKIKSLDYVFIN